MKNNKIIEKKNTTISYYFCFIVLEEVSNTGVTNLENAVFSFTNLLLVIELLRGVNNLRVLCWVQAVV